MTANIAVDEQTHVDSLAHTYFTVQIPMDKKIVYLGYRSFKPYLKGKTALELGSGDGDMTQYLVNDFEQLTVVDGSATLLEGIENYPNLVKHHSLFEDYSPTQRFDTIIMSHVLEHINEPVELLRRAKAWLAPGGVLLASVPNALSFHRLTAVKMGMLKTPTELNPRDLSVGHRRVYTPEAFHSDFAAAGLSIVEQGGILFKAMSNQQMQDCCNDDMLEGYYQLGKEFPYHAAEIYVVAQ